MAAELPHVRLAPGTRSGLASLLRQYLEQVFTELEVARRRAAGLHGRVAVTAADYDATVTLDFRGDEVVIHDGERPPLDASIRGPQRVLLELLRGDGRPLREHLRGRLRVTTSWRRPLFPLQLHRLMRIPPSPQEAGRRRRLLLGVLLGAIALFTAAALVYFSS